MQFSQTTQSASPRPGKVRKISSQVRKHRLTHDGEKREEKNSIFFMI